MLYNEYENSKGITIGDYVKLFGMNDKSEIIIYDLSIEDKLLYSGRIDYLQFASTGEMHTLCDLQIHHFSYCNEIYVDASNYYGRIGAY